ncbi:MAG: ABC transporter ATP-binding protein [Candidatus Atribacteria bacterium]|nr:ABC transporter ATP-binding protein [Candidatus Atribacteria bacterium]
MVSKILEIIGLEKKYNSGFSLKVDHLVTEENKILVMIGPNGSGKSTLIRLINLLESPDSGSIYFNDKLITGKGIDKVMSRKEMYTVFQEPLLFNTSVYNNILMGLEFRGKKISGSKEIFDYLIDKLKIKNLLKRNPRSLSGGEQQRVALARALILEPKLLLLDEPLANIDQLSREELRNDLFDILRATGRSTIYVTHDRNEAMIIADSIAVINEGRIEQFGPKDEVFRKPASEFIAKFVGVETLIEGIVAEYKDNVCRIKIAGCKNDIFAVAASADQGTKVTVAIRPEDVILYNIEINPGSSSAMNSFMGEITEIQDLGIFKKVEIDCGFNLVSFVTQNSIERLGLAPGKKVLSSVKASSVHILAGKALNADRQF